mgnify:CR=1 FL=1
MDAVLGILMRWIHILSAAIALGGIIYARWVAANGAPPDAVAARFRPWAVAAFAGSLGSGFYNFFTKGVYPPGYHMWFGIKFLVALHVLAVLILLALPGRTGEQRQRLMTGAAVSGALVAAAGAYLRWLTSNPR